MKKSYLIVASMVVVLASCSGTSITTVEISGDVTTKEYSNLTDATSLCFKNIILTDGVNSTLPTLRVHTGNEKKVTIKSNEGLFEKLTVETKSNKLSILGKPYTRYKVSSLEVDVYGYDFSSIELAAVNSYFDVNTVKEDLYIAASAATEVVIFDTSYSNLKCDITGASSLYIEADINTNSIEFNATGASEISTNKITTVNAKLDISGASSVVIDQIESNKLNSNVTGASFLETISIIKDSEKYSVSGTSKVNINGGTSPSCEVDCTGASDFIALNHSVNTYVIDLSGASTGKVVLTGASNKLTASGSSNLYYSGDGSFASQELSGGSTINKTESK